MFLKKHSIECFFFSIQLHASLLNLYEEAFK